MEKLVKEAERAIPKPTDRQNLRDCSTSSLLVHLSALCWVYTQLLHSCSHRHDPVQPPMFHTQEAEVAFPSIQAYLTSCKEVRQHTHAALTHFFCRSQRLAVPTAFPCSPVPTRTEDLALPPGSLLVGSFEIEKIINPLAVCLKLPASFRAHPTYHISQIKPVSMSVLNIY